MRKILTLLLVSMTTMLSAQTLNVQVGEVTYQIPAAQAGDMLYSDGTTLTILNKAFALSDITSMYVDNTAVTDNAINVTYNGTTATVTVAGNCMQYLTVNANGSHVSILQSSDLATELKYTLTGTSTNGSFYTDGDYKATVVMNGLTLTCADSAAVNIDNGKRIAIVVEGINTLKDSSSSIGKGALMVNGHSEITGTGTLNIYGYVKHGYWADEYIQLKKSFTGSLNILAAVKDGINVNQYYQQNGGTVKISGVGDDGIQASADDEETGYILIKGGTTDVTVTAANSKGIKAAGNLDISGGTVTVKATGSTSEGIESKDTLTISDGTVTVNSTDDAINSASHMYIKGGTVNVNASGNDGLDSNGNLYIQGGTIIAYGTTSPECGIDANEEQNYHVYFTGGTLLAIGGSNSVPSNSQSTQPYVTTTGTVTSGTTITLKDSTTTLASFNVTRSYSSGGGGGGGGGRPGGGPGGGGQQGGGSGVSILITCPGLTTGSSYTLTNGTTSSTVTATLYGSSSGGGGGGGGRW